MGTNSVDRWSFWVDRGGTFTDVLARSPDGELRALKLLSDNPEQYADATLEAIRRVLGAESVAAIAPGSVAELRVGTTVTTNALLERRGAATVLVTNAGFEDLLRIGDQSRPDLFSLEIASREPLVTAVIGCGGRLDADGIEIEPLDESSLAEALAAARADGAEAVAVALAHAHRNPDHECRVAELARDAGFDAVCCSHAVSPLPGLLGRAETAVADAYVGGVLDAYTGSLADALPGSRLRFMQSGGRLADAARFRGRDSLLSGPAGGVIGAIRSAAAVGIEQLVGFDMGGTSTDVFHYAGELERSHESRVAGLRLRAPTLRVHTVAAGGGSILDYADGRSTVGPASAGANPGPACYRRGGPLTVTDANLLLGRIRAADFPAVFGPGADQPLDEAATREAFDKRTEELNRHAPEPRSPQAVAWGYLQVAVQNMANAIRRITVQRGIDVRGHALVAFGGAGGQLACQVADALGMETVFLHDHAGVLSALGIGLAELGETAEAGVAAPLSADSVAAAEQRIAELRERTARSLAEQGVDAEAVRTEARLRLRYDGAETVLDVAPGSADELRDAFEAAHRQLFGFHEAERGIELVSVSVEAVGGAPGDVDTSVSAVDAGEPETVTFWAADENGEPQPVDAPLHDRDALAEGATVTGPALIREPNSLVVVEPGWRAERLATGLRLQRVAAARQAAPGDTRRDPIRLEIFHNRFIAIAEQMGEALQRTAASVNVRERMDFSCAVYDGRGRLVANAPHIPVHLGSMGAAVQALIAGHGEDFADGDAWLLNDPYHGGTHLPDLTVVTPILAGDGTLRQLVAARAHHADIGGLSPGSMPPFSRRIDDEGVRFTGLRIAHGGRFDEAALREALGAGPYPARRVEQNLVDLRAQIAANRRGVTELESLDAALGAGVVDAYMAHVHDHAAECVRALARTVEPASASVELDNGAVIAVDLAPTERGLRIDFSGSSDQVPGNFNAPLAVTRAAVMYVLRCLVGRPIPLNDGCLAPVELVVPGGSLLNPAPPAAVVAGNVETSQCVVDALLAAFGAQAGSQGTMNNLSFGNERHQYYETICGGTGAGPGFDGASAVHGHMTNSRITDPEVLEARYPVRVERFAVRQGSGGAGKHRGGCGAVRELHFLEPMTVSILSNRRAVAPAGLAGGSDGRCGANSLIRASGNQEGLDGCAQVEVEAGDRILIETPGGGGYGAAE